MSVRSNDSKKREAEHLDIVMFQQRLHEVLLALRGALTMCLQSSPVQLFWLYSTQPTPQQSPREASGYQNGWIFQDNLTPLAKTNNLTSRTIWHRGQFDTIPQKSIKSGYILPTIGGYMTVEGSLRARDWGMWILKNLHLYWKYIHCQQLSAVSNCPRYQIVL